MILTLQTARYGNFLSLDMKHDMSALQYGKIWQEKFGRPFSRRLLVIVPVSPSAGDGVV